MKRIFLLTLCLLLVASLTFMGASADEEEFDVIIRPWSGYLEVNTNQEIGYKGIAYANCSYGLSIDWKDATHYSAQVFYEGTLIQSFDVGDMWWEDPSILSEIEPGCLHGDGKSWYIASWYDDLELDEPGEYLITAEFETTFPLTDGFDLYPEDGVLDMRAPVYRYWETTVVVTKE